MAKIRMSEAIQKLKDMLHDQAKAICELNRMFEKHRNCITELDREIAFVKEFLYQITGKEPRKTEEMPTKAFIDDGETWDPSKGQRKAKKSGRVASIAYDDHVLVRGVKRDLRAAKKDDR